MGGEEGDKPLSSFPTLLAPINKGSAWLPRYDLLVSRGGVAGGELIPHLFQRSLNSRAHLRSLDLGDITAADGT